MLSASNALAGVTSTGRSRPCIHHRPGWGAAAVPCRSTTAAASARQRRHQPIAALPGLAQLFGGAGRQRSRQKRAKYTNAAAELLQLLTHPANSSSVAGKEKSLRISALVEVLLSCEDVPFEERLLAGGPWLVLYTQGSLQLWKATYKAGKAVNAGNAASQDLDPSSRTVINKAEYFGSRLYVTASGTYELLDDSSTLPKPIQANITSGLLYILGLDIPLPIRGTGRFEVVYLDEKLRVFRSSGAVSIQVKQQYLQLAAAGDSLRL